jgi:DUF1680 family protein
LHERKSEFMNRRKFIKTAALVPLATASSRRCFGALVESDSGKPHQQASSMVSGNDRFRLTLQRVLHGNSPAYTEEFILADVRPTSERRFTEYSGDVSGRYIGALATAARVFGTEVPHLDALVDKVIALQKPDGYFGSTFHYDQPTDLDMALLWGNGRLLVGLLEYYRWRPSMPVLAACRRLGDFLVRIGPLMLSKEIRDGFGAQHFASSYICWTQQTEGLALLFSVTKEERFFKLAEDILAVIERRPGDHVHGYLSSLRGVMDLYQVTLRPQQLHQCQVAWQDIAQSKDLLITGGVPEGWSPNNHRTEGCGEADWVRLNLALWKATEDQKYLEMAERAIFNELAFNQYGTGDFGHRVYTETGLPAAGAVRAWWCCTLHGLRAFADIHASAFHYDDRKLRFDLPVDGRIETAQLSAVAVSRLAQNGTVRMTITGADNVRAFLGIRRPPWTERLEVRVNGQHQDVLILNPYVTIDRVWSVGDVVEVSYEMKLSSYSSGERRTSYRYGPWLLGAPAHGNPAFFNELTTENKLVGDADAERPGADPGVLDFQVPVAATSFAYRQAEYPDQPGTVTLRAIAEQTGQPTTSWELRFLTGDHV